MTNFSFQNRVAKSTKGVTWRHRRVFPIRLDRWKAQSVYFLKMHGHASCHTPAWSGWTVMGWRLVKKMTQKLFLEPGCQKYRGVNWRHRRVFPIRLDRWKA